MLIILQKILNTLWINKKTVLSIVLVLSLVLNSLFIYNIYLKPKEMPNMGDNITIPRGVIERILSIKPKVEFKERIVYKEVKNPSTGSQKTGDPITDLNTLENAIPRLEIDPINIIQTTKGISVSKKVNGILDYGYMRHHLTIDLKTKVIKQTYPDIKIGYTNIWQKKGTINDIQLGWYPIHLFNDSIMIGTGLGTKAITLGVSTTILGNITIIGGSAFEYSNWEARPYIGIGFEIF